MNVLFPLNSIQHQFLRKCNLQAKQVYRENENYYCIISECTFVRTLYFEVIKRVGCKDIVEFSHICIIKFRAKSFKGRIVYLQCFLHKNPMMPTF